MKPDARVVSQPVDAPADAVDDFARGMENLPRWAAGLVASVREQDGHWVTDTPNGRVVIDMAPPNAFGVLDHDVTMPDGVSTHNAMRVTPVGDGSLLTFTVLRPAGASDADFDRDCGRVAADLRTLARLVEASRRA